MPSGGGYIGLPILDEDVDKRLAIERQRQGAPQLGIVERRLRRVDDRVARAVVGGASATTNVGSLNQKAADG
jgi:hypothetical protein